MRIALFTLVAVAAAAALAQVPGGSSTPPSLAVPLDGGPDAPLDGGLAFPFDGGSNVPSGAPEAQGRTAPRPPRVSPDAPGTMRAVDPATSSADRGAPQGSSQEVAELRGRVAALEQQIQQRTDEREQLELVNQQLAALRAQLADAEQKVQAQAEQQQAMRENAEQAVNLLAQAQAQLAAGSSNVAEALSAAETALSGQARLDVAAARQALAHDDLYNARRLLAAALSQARAGH